MHRSVDSKAPREVFSALMRKYTLVFVFVGLVFAFSFIAPSFFTLRNMINLVVQNTYILIATVGISFVMMAGAVDLSVGYQISAIGVLTASLITINEVNPLMAMFVGLALAIALGAFNGIVSVKLNVHPIVITIATTTIFQGISFLISNGSNFSSFPDSFRVLTKGAVLGVPVDVWLAAVAVAIASFVYNKTYFGRYVKAMGGNPEATRLAGINTSFIRVATFVISGFFVAIASFILVSKQGATNSTIGPGTEFTCMTAAILGGISFSSGEGKTWGMVIGVFILAVIENGMQLAGWNQYIQYIVKGIVLIAALGFDQYKKQSKSKKPRNGEMAMRLS